MDRRIFEHAEINRREMFATVEHDRIAKQASAGEDRSRAPRFRWRFWLLLIVGAGMVGAGAWALTLLPAINALGLVRDILVLAYLFVLRLGVPLLITLMFGSFIQHWLQQQDVKERRTSRQTAFASAPCWEQKDCPENVCAQCVAFQHPEMPCWLALQVEGYGLKQQCYACPLYVTRPAVVQS